MEAVATTASGSALPALHTRAGLQVPGRGLARRANWRCNGDASPTKALHNDGLSLDPLEVLFVKVSV